MAGALNSRADVERREPDVRPVSDEQPNAPYLEAVVGYAFRGTARYHVPGHKGGPGADPGLRKAIGTDALAADVPQDIHGIDLGPSPTPYERAERLAAEAFGAALREAPDARAAFVVSPTYYGMAADVRGLADVAHAAGVPLIVDQAWGPHFGFHEALPPTAISQGADAMLTSTHKIAGSLTQSASLDSARRQLVLHGEQLLHETLEAIAVARAKLETIEGIALVDDSLVGRMGIAGYDPLRIVLDVRGTGCTGYGIAEALRRSYDVHLELPAHVTLVFVVGLGESVAALRRLAGDIEETVKRIAQPGTTAALVRPRSTIRHEVAVA